MAQSRSRETINNLTFMNSKWKVFEEIGALGIFVKIYVTVESGGSRKIIHFDESGEAIATEVKEGAVDVLPTMVLPHDVWMHMKESFIEELPGPKAPELQAILAAQTKHLEDMRELVFKHKGGI